MNMENTVLAVLIPLGSAGAFADVIGFAALPGAIRADTYPGSAHASLPMRERAA